jgi:hypothetical protein
MIARFLAKRRQQRAKAKLQRIVEETRESFEAEQFRRRREAALKHHRKATA